MTYGFVILHYLTDNDTIACVNSIFEQCKGKNFEIVVVDNHSNNGSIERIRNQFKDVRNIHILYNAENLGFAKGNNVGYRYCREQLGCDTIIILNNDILIASHNLFECIEDDVQKFHSAVIGPDIESLIDGGHQNPMIVSSIASKKQVKLQIIKYKFLLLFNRLNIYDWLLHFKKNKNVKPAVSVIDKNQIQKNVQLHGSFIIFTHIFTKKMDDAFYPETFMYMEESILFQICRRQGFLTCFDPRIHVLHKEDSATNALNIENKKKRVFIFSNIINSSNILLKFM